MQSQPPPYQPTVSVINGEYPVRCVCPICHQDIVTRVEKKNGLTTWLSAGGICIFGAPFGCFLGCCLIPFCINALKDSVHYCPSCAAVLGQHKIIVTGITLNFTIETLWNSGPIVGYRPAQLSLSSTTDRNNLLIQIDATFFDDPAPSVPPGPCPELWNYEVVELFFLASSTNHYIELEFSPHGHYIVLLLVDRRKTLKQLLPLPDYQVERLSSNRWIGRAVVPRVHFPARVDRFNAYAIHGQGNNRTYEALYPAPPDSDKPDFHRLELFQPLNFDLLLNQNEKDGESWNNHASHTTSFSFLLLLPLLLILYI